MRRILKDKQKLRERLASKPISEKLRILEQLRAREVAIRTGARSLRGPGSGASAGGDRSSEKKR